MNFRFLFTIPVVVGVILGAQMLFAAPRDARNLLLHDGFTDVTLVRHDWLTCDDQNLHDLWFLAISPGGQKVSVHICTAPNFVDPNVVVVRLIDA